MFKNYFKIAWRNLIKNKTFSFINIFGFAVGLATCFLLLLYVFDELNHDKHHKDVDQIYRIATQVKMKKWAATPAPLAQGLILDFPEVTDAVRVLNFPNTNNLLLKDELNNKQFYETKGYYVDSNFFEVFTYEFISGNMKTALTEPNTVVISEEVAHKMFGNDNPINKTITIEIPYGKISYSVTGVFKKGKNKSHINPNLLLSMENGDIGQWVKGQTSWVNNNLFHTYLKLEKGSDVELFKEKLPMFFDKYAGKELAEVKIEKNLFLQPLKDIYLKSDIGNEISTNGSMTYIYIFSSIALFLILIGCINFMNLSTARSEKRAKEVGVRKVMGAQRESLIFQFLGESLIMCFLALIVALIIVIVMLPGFNAFTQKSLLLFETPKLLLWIVGLTLFSGMLSGLYPAFYLSSFKPSSILKGIVVNAISAKLIRKGLVVFQFSISFCLILVAAVIWQQLDFIQNQDLGFKKEHQIVVPFRNETVVKNYEVLKEAALKDPNIAFVTAASTYPGFELVSDMSFYAEDKSIDDHVYMKFAQCNEDYIKTLDYEIINGQSLSDRETFTSDVIVLNETAIRHLGYTTESAVGRSVFYEFNGEKERLEIVGIVKDFNHQSLHETITPYGIVALEPTQQPSYCIANVREGKLSETIKQIEKIWTTINPKTPFEYSLLDDDLSKNYVVEQRTSKIITYFTLVAIFIACIGLFGLASFTTEQRRKEVGIRRVLGASVMGITSMHLKDFLKLVLLAMIIASPLAYYLGHRWLENFAYKVGMSWWLFLSATCIALFIAFVTVGFQVIKAATSNPVKSLRTE